MNAILAPEGPFQVNLALLKVQTKILMKKGRQNVEFS